MISQPRTPRLTQSGPVATAARVFALSDIKTTSQRNPRRFGLHAKSGWGKSSLGAQFPKPIFVENEAGLDPLIEYGLIPETPHFPPVQSWSDLLGIIDFLTETEHTYKTAVFDSIDGFERLCHEHVCQRDFAGEWGDKGFGGYQRGYEVSLADWRIFLNKLDRLREAKGMTVLLLAHTKLRTVRNPVGPDYDKWRPDMHEKTWSLTEAWLDGVFFGDFEVVVQTAGKSDAAMKKGKIAGGSIRVLYTQNSPSYDAKNRLGLPEEIDVGDSAKDAYANFVTAIKEAKKAEASDAK